MGTAALWNWGEPITFEAPGRKVDSVWLHCSASDNPAHDDVSTMRAWHLKRGWSDVGYHLFITKAGHIQPGRPLEKVPAAQEGHNSGAIAMCAHGLLEANFTTNQLDSVIRLCTAIQQAYSTPLRFRGHCEVSTKTCPVFNYRAVLGLNANGLLGGPTTTAPKGASAAPVSGPGATKPSGALQITSRGVPVKVLQNLLVVNGVPCAADGIFGQATAGAVQKFQGLIGVPATGVADNPTQKWLAKGLPGLKPLSLGDSGDSVAAFQRILNLHHCPVGVDGVFGAGMLGGVQAFQRKYGLSVSGAVDEGTRRASWR
jgi:N-acetylmuramoyl-L-alanine amidase